MRRLRQAARRARPRRSLQSELSDVMAALSHLLSNTSSSSADAALPAVLPAYVAGRRVDRLSSQFFTVVHKSDMSRSRAGRPRRAGRTVRSQEGGPAPCPALLYSPSQGFTCMCT